VLITRCGRRVHLRNEADCDEHYRLSDLTEMSEGTAKLDTLDYSERGNDERQHCNHAPRDRGD
jgi:hypothetical protein